MAKKTEALKGKKEEIITPSIPDPIDVNNQITPLVVVADAPKKVNENVSQNPTNGTGSNTAGNKVQEATAPVETPVQTNSEPKVMTPAELQASDPTDQQAQDALTNEVNNKEAAAEEKIMDDTMNMYNNNPALQELYDLKTDESGKSRLIPKRASINLKYKDDQGNTQAVETTIDPAAKKPEEKTAGLTDSQQEVVDSFTAQESVYDQMLKELEAQRDAYAQDATATTKQDYALSFFGGLTEGIAALANLWGTTKGATSQKWTSPQPTWQNRIDTLRNQRETKLERYQQQIQTLNNAKKQLLQAKSSYMGQVERANSSTERAKIQADAAIAKVQAQAEATVQKAEIQARLQALKLDQATSKAISDQAIKMAMQHIKDNYSSQGYQVSKKRMEEIIDDSIEYAIKLNTRASEQATAQQPVDDFFARK